MRTKLFISFSLAVLLFSVFNVAYSRERTRKFNDFVTYKGEVDKKQPCGTGVMVVALPKLYNVDILSGVFDGFYVSEGRIAFANEKSRIGNSQLVELIVFTGNFTVDIQPSYISYRLLEGRISGGEADIQITKEHVITRNYLDDSKSIILQDFPLSWVINNHNRQEEPYKSMFSFADNASNVEITAIGTITIDTWSYGQVNCKPTTSYTLNFHNGYIGELITGVNDPRAWEPTDTELHRIVFYDKPYYEFRIQKDNDYLRVVHQKGGDHYDAIEYQRNGDDFVLKKTQKPISRWSNTSEDPHLYLLNDLSDYLSPEQKTALEDYLPSNNFTSDNRERFCEYGGVRNYNSVTIGAITVVDYSNGAKFVGQLKQEKGSIPSEDYLVGVYTANDGQQEIYYNGIPFTEIKRDYYARKQREHEEALERQRAAEERRLKEEAETQARIEKERSPLYQKYGREIVDFWYDNDKKVKVGMSEAMILDLLKREDKTRRDSSYSYYDAKLIKESTYTRMYELYHFYHFFQPTSSLVCWFLVDVATGKVTRVDYD